MRKATVNPIIIQVFEYNKDDVREPYVLDQYNKENARVLVFKSLVRIHVLWYLKDRMQGVRKKK